MRQKPPAAGNERKALDASALRVLGRLLAEFDGPSLVALLYAACSSPGCRHRLPTMTALWVAALAYPPAGTRPARYDDLPGFADAARAACPALAAAEDWVPHDPAAGAEAETESGSFPLHPGLLSDPFGALDNLLSYARAVDPELARRGRVTLAESVAAAAWLLSDQHAALGGAWPTGTKPNPGDPPELTAAEHETATAWLPTAALPDQDPMARVLVDATVDAAALAVSLAWPTGLLGPVLAVRASGRVLPVPAGLVLSGAAAIADALIDAAAALGPRTRARVDRRWQREAAAVLADAASRLQAHVFYPVRIWGAGRRRFLLVVTGSRHAYLFGTVASVARPLLARRAARARRRLSRAATADRLLVRLPAFGLPPGTDERRGLWLPDLARALPAETGGRWGRRRGWRRLAPGTVLRTGVLTHGPAAPPGTREPGRRYADVVDLPLLTFRDAAADVAHADEPAELWAFVDELASFATDGVDAPPVAFHALEPGDLWSAWREAAMLAPAWRPAGAVVSAAGTPAVDRWSARAARSHLDALLRRAGLPPSRDWAHVSDPPVPYAAPASGRRGWTETGRDTATLTWSEPRILAFASVADDVIVSVPLHDPDPGQTQRIVAFADAVLAGVQQTAHDPGAWQRWQAAAAGGAVHVEIDPRPADAGPADEGPAAVWPVACRAGHVLLGVRTGVADRTTDTGLHAHVGRALALAVAALSGTADAGRPDAIFLDAWMRVPPTLERHRVLEPFGAAAVEPGPVLSDRMMRRATRTVAASLRGTIEPGRHPVDVARLTVAPRALDVLRAACAPFEPDALLDAVCAEAERAAADRFGDRQRRQVAVQGRWAIERAEALLADSDDGAAALSRSAELLVECVLRDPPNGTMVPDRVDVNRLLHLACVPLQFSLRAAHASAGLQPMTLLVTPDGRIGLIPTGPPAVDVGAWRTAQWASDLRHARRAAMPQAEDVPPGDGGDAPFASVRAELERVATGRGRDADLSRRMLAVDDALLAGCGFGLDGAKAVLDTAIAIEVPDVPLAPVGRRDASDLAGDAAAWARLPVGQVEAALNRMTLTSQALRAIDLRYWHLEQRDVRFALRPLVGAFPSASDGRLRVLPRKAFNTRDILIRYVADGRLPWPPATLPRQVTSAVDRWRQHAERTLEVQTLDAVRDSGLATLGGLTQRRAAASGLPLPGEVDVLAVDAARSRIWVLECKHLREPFGPVEIARHVAAFHGSEALPGALDAFGLARRRSSAYVEALLTKSAAVRAHPDAAATAVAAGDPAAVGPRPRPWQIVPAVVTSHVEVAAFVTDPRVVFVELADLPALLTADDLPADGWWGPPRTLPEAP